MPEKEKARGKTAISGLMITRDRTIVAVSVTKDPSEMGKFFPEMGRAIAFVERYAEGMPILLAFNPKTDSASSAVRDPLRSEEIRGDVLVFGYARCVSGLDIISLPEKTKERIIARQDHRADCDGANYAVLLYSSSPNKGNAVFDDFMNR